MKKRHRTVIRLLCVVCAAVLLIGTATVDCSPEHTLTASLPESAGSCVRWKDAVTLAAESAEALPYVSDAAMNELNGIVTYALGNDPTEGKAITDAGQNTKNNVAISILWLLKSLRHVYSMRCVLEPYPSSDNVYEMCAYVRRTFSKNEECIHTGWLYDRTNRKISAEDGTGMMGIGYDFNYEFNTFFAGSDPWQRNFGFCRMYDGAAFLIGDVYETIRIPFRCGDKDWMIQVWKGIYSWNMLGGEIGLYNKPIDRDAAFYDCATDPERIPMAFSVSLGNETIVQTDMFPSWWQTMFTQHKLARPRDLTMEFSLTFPDRKMADAFCKSLQNEHPDVLIRRSGLTVCCVWAAGK